MKENSKEEEEQEEEPEEEEKQEEEEQEEGEQEEEDPIHHSYCNSDISPLPVGHFPWALVVSLVDFLPFEEFLFSLQSLVNGFNWAFQDIW